MSFISAAQIRAQRTASQSQVPAETHHDDPPLLFKGGDRGVVADAGASVGEGAQDQDQHHPQTPSSEEEGASSASDFSADTPNLPALIDALPGDHTRAPQTQFDRERQVAFLEALATRGSVRHAATKAQVSHQSVYRARRANRVFRRAWDAALVVARGRAEAVLADRAIEGIEEQVFYHGEVVATRRRYDSRLLLAHLARLDRLAGDEDAGALAEDFDGMLGRFAAGEALEDPEARVPAQAGTSGGGAEPPEAPACAGARNSSPGQCNTWSMSPADPPSSSGAVGRTGTPPGGEDDAEPDEGFSGDPLENAAMPLAERLRTRTPPPYYDEWEEDMDDPAHWENGEYIPPLGRLMRAMDTDRPADAPAPGLLGDVDEVEAWQMAAFEAGVERWWLVIPPEEGDESAEWCYAK